MELRARAAGSAGVGWLPARAGDSSGGGAACGASGAGAGDDDGEHRERRAAGEFDPFRSPGLSGGNRRLPVKDPLWYLPTG